MKTKKVCFYVDSVFDLGGIQRVVTTLSNNLYKDYDITVLCQYEVNDKNKVDYKLNKNIKVDFLEEEKTFLYFLDYVFKPFRFINRRFKIFNKDSKISSYLEYYSRYFILFNTVKYFKKNNFDYILAESIDSSIKLSLCRKYINSYIIGCWHSSWDIYYRTRPIELIKKSLETLDKTIVLSNNDRKLIKKNLNIDVNYIYNTVDRLNINRKSKNEKKFIAVGRYHSIKGFDELIEIFNIFHKTNKDWKLDIIGEGPERENLQKLIYSYNLENYITLVGKTSNISKYYMNSSIFLITSKSEGFGMVLVEAMQYKLPIISFDVPVFREILPPSVPIIEKRNKEEFAEKMIELINNKDNINDMVNDYDKYLEKFYIENVKEEWKKILK